MEARRPDCMVELPFLGGPSNLIKHEQNNRIFSRRPWSGQKS